MKSIKFSDSDPANPLLKTYIEKAYKEKKKGEKKKIYTPVLFVKVNIRNSLDVQNVEFVKLIVV